MRALLGCKRSWWSGVSSRRRDTQARHEEQDVVYLLGDELRPWLSGLPEKLNAPQRAALTTALREVRASLATSR